MLSKIKQIFQSSGFKTVGIFAGGNFLIAIISGLGGLLQSRWIAPEVLGEFRKYGILTSYFFIGLVVVHDGITRQYPFLIGKGERTEALQMVATAKWWYLLLSWVFSLFFLVLVVRALIIGQYRDAAGWSTQIAMVWTVYYGAYQNVMYRTSSDFRRLSYNNLVSSILNFCMLIVVRLWEFWGLALRFALGNIVSILINLKYLPVKVYAKRDFPRLKKLAKISLPLSIPGYLNTSFLSATLSFFILKYCGSKELGLYGVAVTFIGFGMTVTAAFNQIVSVKITGKYGETGSIATCLRWAILPMLFSMMVACAIAVGICLVIKPVIAFLLPRYADATPIIQIMSLEIPLAALSLPLVAFRTALWFKSLWIYAVARFLSFLLFVIVLPKNLLLLIVSYEGALFVAIATGYVLLWINHQQKEKLPLSENETNG